MRTDLPLYGDEYDTAWAEALAVVTRLDDVDVPCAMSIAERERLFKLCKAIGAKRVLDIGTYVGSSALAFALSGAHVTTVDIKPVNAPDAYWAQVGRAMSPTDLMRTAGVMDRVRFVQSDAREYLKGAPPDNFDLISIDGWHEEHAVYDELGLALNRLTPGGLIFMHDVQWCPPPPGVDAIPGPLKALRQRLTEGAPYRAIFERPGIAFLVGRGLSV